MHASLFIDIRKKKLFYDIDCFTYAIRKISIVDTHRLY